MVEDQLLPQQQHPSPRVRIDACPSVTQEQESDLTSFGSDEEVFMTDDTYPNTRSALKRQPAIRRKRMYIDEDSTDLHNLNVHIPPYKGLPRPLQPTSVNTHDTQILTDVLSQVQSTSKATQHHGQEEGQTYASPGIALPYFRPKRRPYYKKFYYSRSGRENGEERKKE